MQKGLQLTGAALLGLSAVTVSAQQDRPLTPDELEFFEARIRPALIENCYECHSGDGSVKGGLQVDGKAALLKGGSTGPAVVPGDPGRSLLIKAISWNDPNLQMPPNSKLPDSVIADLENWVRMGAPDPRVGKAAGVVKSEMNKDKVKDHWAFKEVKKPAVPEPKSHLKQWLKNDIDYFILAKLEEKEMLPSPPADKWTLARRAYYDLIGMPPTAKEVEEFVTDASPKAWENLIDKLLESPHYGERWGRYWLDVARYADTRGAGNNNRNMRNRMVHAWTYRDWVVKALNEDMPYNDFLRNQIAADLIHGTRQEDLAALGFLSITRATNNKQEDIDDKIDAITRGMMCLSVYCARCHDHKFDPVATKDYYALYGVFDSINARQDSPPLIENPQLNPNYTNYLYQVGRIKYDREQFKVEKVGEYVGEAKSNMVSYLMMTHMMEKTTNFPLNGRADQDRFERRTKLEAEIARGWSTYINGRTKNNKDRVFGPWKDYTDLAAAVMVTNFVPNTSGMMMGRMGANDDDMGTADLVTIGNAVYRRIITTDYRVDYTKSRALAKKYWSDGKPAAGLNPRVAKAFQTPIKDLRIVAIKYAQLFAEAEQEWGKALQKDYKDRVMRKDAEAQPIAKLEDKDWEELRQVYYGSRSPVNVTYDRLARMDNNRIGNEENRRFTDAQERLEMTHPGAPARAMTVSDLSNPRNSKVFIKGDPRNTGEDVVPRRFIEVLKPGGKPYSDRGSGRLELADDVASKKNPLTARVMINRAWMHHFGGPIVRTPTDFGVRAEDPSHPEMLDYLAAWFMENNWSLKKLHKFIMTSATYMQSSEIRPKSYAVDAANLSFWRMNRRRLDFEGFRDSLLAVSGMADLTVGGKPVNLMSTPYAMRRTVYGYIDRQNLGTIFQTFDFANPNMTTGQRFSSTVPQQALFMMNSGFIAELARGMVMSDAVQNKIDEPQRIEALYSLAYQRPPSPIETKLGIRFLEQQHSLEKGMKPATIWTYGFGAYDVRTRKLQRFTPLPYYSIVDGAWQGSERFPDARFGNSRLTSDGGHPGPNLGMSVIRRWTAPRDGVVSINGSLEHPGRNGDGVTGYIVVRGELPVGTYVVFNRRVSTSVPKLKVQAGDTVDFVVDYRGNAVGDDFVWAPTIALEDALMPFLPTAQNLGATVAVAPGGTVNNLAAMTAGTASTSGMTPMGAMAGGNPVGGPKTSWKAAEDFYSEQAAAGSKSLSTWEKYAQVLLLSNEMMYVD